MLARLLLTLVGLSVIGSAMLELRRQRIEQLHAITELHRQIDADRKATWDLQHRIVQATSPDRLAEALEQTDIQTQPVPSSPKPRVNEPVLHSPRPTPTKLWSLPADFSPQATVSFPVQLGRDD